MRQKRQTHQTENDVLEATTGYSMQRCCGRAEIPPLTVSLSLPLHMLMPTAAAAAAALS